MQSAIVPDHTQAVQDGTGLTAGAAGHAAPVGNTGEPVQGSAEPAETDSANQQQPTDAADSASAKTSCQDALAAAPAARVMNGGQQGSAEFQEGVHRGTQGAAMACSEPCSGLPAVTQGRVPSAASAAAAIQDDVLAAQGSGAAAAHDGAPTTASKVRHWTENFFLNMHSAWVYPLNLCRRAEFRHRCVNPWPEGLHSHLLGACSAMLHLVMD